MNRGWGKPSSDLEWRWTNPLVLSTVGDGRRGHDRRVPATDGRSDLTRRSPPWSPSQTLQIQRNRLLVLLNYCSSKTQCRSCHFSVTQNCCTVLFLFPFFFFFLFCIEAAPGRSELGSRLSGLYCGKCWGLPSLKTLQTGGVVDLNLTDQMSV